MPAEHPYGRHHRPPSPPILPSPPPPPPPPPVRKHYSAALPAPHRHYTPYIPLPPDLLDYVHSSKAAASSMTTTINRSRQRSSPSPARRHEQRKSRLSRSSSNSTHVDGEPRVQSEASRILVVEQLDRDISESKLRDIFGRYGTIEQSKRKRLEERDKMHLFRFSSFEAIETCLRIDSV